MMGMENSLTNRSEKMNCLSPSLNILGEMLVWNPVYDSAPLMRSESLRSEWGIRVKSARISLRDLRPPHTASSGELFGRVLSNFPESTSGATALELKSSNWAQRLEPACRDRWRGQELKETQSEVVNSLYLLFNIKRAISHGSLDTVESTAAG